MFDKFRIFIDFIMIYLLIYVKWYLYCVYFIFFCNFNWKKKFCYNYFILKYKCIFICELMFGVCGCFFFNLCGGFFSFFKWIEINLIKYGVFLFFFEKNFIFFFKKCLVYFMLFGFIFFFVVFFCNNIIFILFFSYKCKFI